jgi:hypothetical protein
MEYFGESWSAASEGVPAALRLSKSAPSADKVHFSDPSDPFQSPESIACPYHLVVVTIDHIRA